LPDDRFVVQVFTRSNVMNSHSGDDLSYSGTAKKALADMREKGATVQTVNRTLRTMKAVIFFAIEREILERNPLQRFRPFEDGEHEQHVRRDALSELEIRAVRAAAAPTERALLGLLCFT
jgi:site-specific recombinase XerD